MQTINMQISQIFITSANSYRHVFPLSLYNFDDWLWTFPYIQGNLDEKQRYPIMTGK